VDSQLDGPRPQPHRGHRALPGCRRRRSALEYFSALRDAVTGRPPSPALADALAGRSYVLRDLGRFPEAAEEARRALAAAREVGHPVGEALALMDLALSAEAAGDVGEAVRLARRAVQVPGDIPASITRACGMFLVQVLTENDDFAAAELVCADGLAASRDAGDLMNQQSLLARMTLLDLRAGCAEDAAAHLREALQLALRTGLWPAVYLDYCGHLCAATGRHAEAITAWAAWAPPAPRSPPSCPSASAPSARTWTGSGTKPAAAAALT
jgi:tetratricopeptide (TPR) repeat protein